MNELTVVLKDSERTYRHKFLAYEPYEVTEDNPFIIECIAEAVKIFGNDPETIQIKIHMEIQ